MHIRLDKIYKYPVLIFYFYYFKRSEITLKEWRDILVTYDYDDSLGHPIKNFIDMVDQYGI